MRNTYNQFSDKYNDIFVEAAMRFSAQFRELYFHTFYPSFGIARHQKADFLIVGQAVNGWDSSLSYEHLSDKDIRNTILSEAVLASNTYPETLDGFTPLDWVNVKWSKSIYEEFCKDERIKKFYTNSNSYWLFRSFFWNVTFKIICDYYNLPRGSREWTQKMVWSNLYKLAPEDANPTDFQRQFQFTSSVELLKQELLELNPKFCLILTNLSWWIPFSEKIGTKKIGLDQDLDCIESFEEFGGTKIIVTTRPRFGNGEKHVAQILALIGKFQMN
jgi:hypothetical protein